MSSNEQQAKELAELDVLLAAELSEFGNWKHIDYGGAHHIRRPENWKHMSVSQRQNYVRWKQLSDSQRQDYIDQQTLAVNDATKELKRNETTNKKESINEEEKEDEGEEDREEEEKKEEKEEIHVHVEEMLETSQPDVDITTTITTIPKTHRSWWCEWCFKKHTTEHLLKLCLQCCTTAYCDENCQKIHWMRHHADCIETYWKANDIKICVSTLAQYERAAMMDQEDKYRHGVDCFMVVDRRKVSKEKSEEEEVEDISTSVSSTISSSSVVAAEGETKLSEEPKEVSVEKQNKCTEMLYKAVQARNLTMIQLVLAKNETNVNRCSSSGFTPLDSACSIVSISNGHLDVVKLLLGAEGINVNQATNDGVTALYIASENGHLELMKLLLDAEGINVNEARNDGATALYMASQNGHSNAVKLLLVAEGVNYNQHTKRNQTPLNIASYNGHVEIVRLLLQQPNIDLNKKDDWNDSPLDAARKKNHTDIAQLLTDAGCVLTVTE